MRFKMYIKNVLVLNVFEKISKTLKYEKLLLFIKTFESENIF